MVTKGNIREDKELAVPEEEYLPSYLKKLHINYEKEPKLGFTGLSTDMELFPYPFDDESMYEIIVDNFIHKVLDLGAFMNECHRLLVPLGPMIITAPYYTSIDAVGYERLIHENSLKEFEDKFEFAYYRYTYHPEWESRGNEAQVWAKKHYWNVVKIFEIGLNKKGREK